MQFKIKFNKTVWGTQTMFFNEDSTIRFALYTYDDDDKTVYFSNLFIDETLRHNGYADKILEWVFAYAKKNSYDFVVLNVVKNSWMQNWYERHGFVYVEDCIEDEYKGNVWLKKKLS